MNESLYLYPSRRRPRRGWRFIAAVVASLVAAVLYPAIMDLAHRPGQSGDPSVTTVARVAISHVTGRPATANRSVIVVSGFAHDFHAGEVIVAVAVPKPAASALGGARSSQIVYVSKPATLNSDGEWTAKLKVPSGVEYDVRAKRISGSEDCTQPTCIARLRNDARVGFRERGWSATVTYRTPRGHH